MKFGKLEGTHQEIKDFIENNGLRLEDYIQKPVATTFSKRYFCIPSILFLTSLGALVFLGVENIKIYTFLIILGLGFIAWLIATIQIHFSNVWATTFVGLVLILMLSIASGLLPVGEALEILKKRLSS